MKVVIPALCVYQKFNVLPIRKLHQFQLLCIVHKYEYLRSQLPAIFHDYFTDNSSIHDHDTRSKNNLHVSCIHYLRMLMQLQSWILSKKSTFIILFSGYCYLSILY